MGRGRAGVHVFKSSHWCAEVEVFYVNTHELSVGSAHDTIAKNFKCCEVCCVHGEFTWGCDEVAICGNTDSV